ncbi:hypothetical protein K431DRAFT_285588 [Polychaeton citri CBS 116435]|uniref:Molybdopterin synthase sulfur carrier subunit n=1 Tax=Polychaeton citri CBS 116435 TaxID=1314669 RepID=A0A9P4Q9I0_9PEZI|nr:hypothetical protein K431DRAFT_285588 [Polychaeton citri CBS 116435]
MAAQRPPPGHFKLLYFAAARSFANADSDVFPAPQPLASLFAVLEAKYPGIKERVLGSCAVTVNLDYVDVDEEGQLVIQDQDEVAIIPPVSSG